MINLVKYFWTLFFKFTFKCNLDDYEKIEMSSLKAYLSKFRRIIKEDKKGNTSFLNLKPLSKKEPRVNKHT